MPDENLAKQLAMNVQTWASLQGHGVTEQTNLRLDFFFEAPTAAAAGKIVKLLKEETDYDVSTPRGSGSFFSRGFVVSGTTQETKVSLDVLDQWVDWMVAAGRQSGCSFDGWAAKVPAAA